MYQILIGGIQGAHGRLEASLLFILIIVKRAKHGFLARISVLTKKISSTLYHQPFLPFKLSQVEVQRDSYKICPVSSSLPSSSSNTISKCCCQSNFPWQFYCSLHFRTRSLFPTSSNSTSPFVFYFTHYCVQIYTSNLLVVKRWSNGQS